MYNNIGNLFRLPADVNLNFFINSFNANKYRTGDGFKCNFPSISNNYPSSSPGYLFLWRDEAMIKMYYITETTNYATGYLYQGSSINKIQWYTLVDSGMTISNRDSSQQALITEKEFKDLLFIYISQYDDKELWELLSTKLDITTISGYTNITNPVISRLMSVTPKKHGDVVLSSGGRFNKIIIEDGTKIAATTGRSGKSFTTSPTTTLRGDNLLNKSDTTWTEAFDDYKMNALSYDDSTYTDAILRGVTTPYNYRLDDSSQKILKTHFGSPGKHVTKHFLCSVNRPRHEYNNESNSATFYKGSEKAILNGEDNRIATWSDFTWKVIYDGTNASVKSFVIPASAKEVLFQFATLFGDIEGVRSGVVIGIQTYTFWLYPKYREFPYFYTAANLNTDVFIYNAMVRQNLTSFSVLNQPRGAAAWRVNAPKVGAKRAGDSRAETADVIWVRRVWWR